MEFLISPKTQIIKLIQSLVLTRGHWRFKGDHRLAATWTRSWSHRWGGAWWSRSAARKAERGSMNVKAAGEEKVGWGSDWAGRCGGKMMKGKPLCQGSEVKALPHCRVHRQVPAPAVTNALLSGQGSGSLSEAPLAPRVNTESFHSLGPVTSLLGVFPLVTLAQEV